MRRLSDSDIIEGICSYNEQVTKDYFYPICKTAYHKLKSHHAKILNYQGLEEMALAHEYYLYLLTRDFEPLLRKPKEKDLRAWMLVGIQYMLRDKAKKLEGSPFDDRDFDEGFYHVVGAVSQDTGILSQVVEAVESHYGDETMTQIARKVLYEGYKQSEVATELGISPSAVNQRYKRMMDEVVAPYVMENYESPSIAEQSVVCVSPQKKTCDSLMLIYGFNDRRRPSVSPLQEDLYLTSLAPNEIFVFGSNLLGIHVGGAAEMAHRLFGAEMGKGIGRQGQSYAIPTMQGGVETIAPYVDDFILYAKAHPELHFRVTSIGCGVAGFSPKEIAPIFRKALSMKNITLPNSFLTV